MFISKIELKNFKRFTDLTVDLSGINKLPKLVLMIGENGSGKSSIFDAFEWVSQFGKNDTPESMVSIHNRFVNELPYYKKNELNAEAVLYFNDNKVLFKNSNGMSTIENSWVRLAFYGRSALRSVPQLTRTSIGGREGIASQDNDRPRFYIEQDTRFENDVDILAERIVNEIFVEGRFDANELRKRYIEPINKALQRVFTDDPAISLSLVLIMPPLQGKPVQIRFRKGASEILYDLLSNGEKEVINILFNLFIRRGSFQDTIYFIDELDVHLNTALQYNLIKEITENWIPDNCQLWTASHSLGFIQYAREAKHAEILDFDQLDFDVPQTITPQPKEVLEMFEVAVPKDMMLKVFQGKQIILCENKNDEYYNLLGLPQKIFVGVQDKRQVYLNVKNTPAYFGLMDRDYLTDQEIQKISQHFPNLKVLNYYAFENYLLHPDNIAELEPSFDVAAYTADIIQQKNTYRDFILTGIAGARNGYSILKDKNINEDENWKETIIMALRSDKLEDFYPFFDMKTRFNKNLISSLKLPTSKLVSTNWFKNSISKLLA